MQKSDILKVLKKKFIVKLGFVRLNSKRYSYTDSRYDIIKNKTDCIIMQLLIGNNTILLFLLQILYSNISNLRNTISDMIKRTHE